MSIDPKKDLLLWSVGIAALMLLVVGAAALMHAH